MSKQLLREYTIHYTTQKPSTTLEAETMYTLDDGFIFKTWCDKATSYKEVGFIRKESVEKITSKDVTRG